MKSPRVRHDLITYQDCKQFVAILFVADDENLHLQDYICAVDGIQYECYIIAPIMFNRFLLPLL